VRSVLAQNDVIANVSNPLPCTLVCNQLKSLPASVLLACRVPRQCSSPAINGLNGRTVQAMAENPADG
jgi:hypothetical protein